MSNRLIALIAEDETDCDTIRVIARRVLNNQSLRIKIWAAKGCGNLKKDLPAKLKAMSNQGCDAFIIIHDLDRNDEAQLRITLEKASSIVKGANRHICIPIEELEAWFWSDLEVIKSVGRGKGNAERNPHLISSPKEKLIKLSVGDNRKPRYSTNENVELAAKLNLEICSERCPSFKSLIEFLRSL